MIWILLAFILALPVLLGLIPGLDATLARRQVVRTMIAGGVVGLIAIPVFLMVSPEVPFGFTLAFPPLWGALGGAGIGLTRVVLRRFLPRRRAGRLS